MRTIEKHILLLLAAVLSVGAEAQVMTLQECLQEGLDRNWQIRIARIDEEVSANNDSWAAAGGMPSLDLSAQYSGSGAADHTVSASVSASWMVFNGFKVVATREKMRELHSQGELRTRIAIEDFVSQMVSEYYNYVRQSIRMHHLNYAAELSKERLRIVQERYSIGNNSRLDLKQTQVYFNADSAKCLKQNEALATARIRINRLMAEEHPDRHFTVADTAIALKAGLNYAELEQDMLESNLSLIGAESSSRVAQEDLRSVNARNYPYLRLNAEYSFSHNTYSSGTLSSRSNWGPGIGATLGINLLDGKHRTDRQNAELNIRNAELSRQEVEQSLRASLADLWQAYQNNLRLLQLEQQNLLTARESHQIACERYLIGDLSGLEMREAQISLLDAEESLLQVRYDTKLCEVSLMQISGHAMDYLLSDR